MSPLVCLVTGCSEPRGFGRLSAEELHRRGHVVVATMRDATGRNRAAAEELAGLADVAELDVTDDAAVTRLVEDVLDRRGRVDAVVNNAAYVAMGPVESIDVASLRAAFDTNVLGPHRLVRAVLPHMRARGSGVIVQVSSISGYVTSPLFGAYCATKYALEAYSEALAYEVGRFGVRVAIVEPGAFDTGLHARGRWEPGSTEGPYGPLIRREWDEELEEWVAGMGEPAVVAQVIADAVERADTPLHVPVGDDAVEWAERARPLTDDERRNAAFADPTAW
jgi:NAD(P)-dependent dehydrogenase (short-subunit alcohol dehydrogenase family)